MVKSLKTLVAITVLFSLSLVLLPQKTSAAIDMERMYFPHAENAQSFYPSKYIAGVAKIQTDTDMDDYSGDVVAPHINNTFINIHPTITRFVCTICK
ncbi:MAG TPA: hypothetical protein DCS29_00690 [Candidatus Magasanikbacteria bacterium]|nr:MAG: hypothetical protein A2479_04420 [Candidatus Magasanikbacteria bacterium RIFOXYC2_FULL_39_8]HAT03283.1 hypothetical protein [Candidatus Magasanikbacteria bacterium]